MMYGSRKIVLSLIACYTIFYLTGCQGDHGEKPSNKIQHPAAEVTVVTVKKEKSISLTEIMGTVQAVERATIGARVNGHIVKLPVVLGSKVKKGDLLVSISAGEISAQLLQAQAQLTKAQRNLDRERKLLKKNATTPETVKSLEDIKRIAEASYKEAHTMLGFTRIEAPFDGTITGKIANIGDLATAGKPLLFLENDKSLQVIADVPEALILKVKTADQLPVNIPAAGLKINGQVTEVAPATDPLSRTAPIKLAIAAHENLRPGQFARVTLQGSARETIIVPESSVSRFGQMERIFVVSDNQARLRLVRSGTHQNGKLEILTGLADGEAIITSSNINLHDGQSIILNK